ncbi:hypothetical protein TNCV_4621891 [Trichonephila clavipes]|nr:hypothetical protein TNCV_4621891 [Trichonephila clavipes]
MTVTKVLAKIFWTEIILHLREGGPDVEKSVAENYEIFSICDDSVSEKTELKTMSTDKFPLQPADGQEIKGIGELVTGSRVFSLICPLGSLRPELVATLFQPNPRSEV